MREKNILVALIHTLCLMAVFLCVLGTVSFQQKQKANENPVSNAYLNDFEIDFYNDTITMASQSSGGGNTSFESRVMMDVRTVIDAVTERIPGRLSVSGCLTVKGSGDSVLTELILKEDRGKRILKKSFPVNGEFPVAFIGEGLWYCVETREGRHFLEAGGQTFEVAGILKNNSYTGVDKTLELVDKEVLISRELGVYLNRVFNNGAAFTISLQTDLSKEDCEKLLLECEWEGIRWELHGASGETFVVEEFIMEQVTGYIYKIILVFCIFAIFTLLLYETITRIADYRIYRALGAGILFSFWTDVKDWVLLDLFSALVSFGILKLMHFDDQGIPLLMAGETCVLTWGILQFLRLFIMGGIFLRLNGKKHH